MKATITDVPQPKPPRVVTLEMTEEEAQSLINLTYYTTTIPSVISGTYPDVPDAANFLRHIKRALRDVGLRVQS